jgi:phage/plasmid-like protein (TIGR03299 family)
MSHEVENMMYVGNKPWHGLGIEVSNVGSVEEAMNLSGLNWTVRKEQLMLANGTLVQRYAVIRESDNRVLGTVGPDWKEIQNSEAFSVLDPFLKYGEASIETAGCLFQGGRVWMLLKIKRPDAVIVPQADDTVGKYILAAVGHDGTLSFTLGITPIRVVCNNTLSVSLGDGAKSHVKIRHLSKSSDAITALRNTINDVDAKIEKAAEVFRALAGKNITGSAQLKAYINSVFPPIKQVKPGEEKPAETFSDLLQKPATFSFNKTEYEGEAPMLATQREVDAAVSTVDEDRRIFEKIENLYETGRGNRPAGVRHTAWAAYNAVTEYNTWERGRTVDSRLNSVWLSQYGAVSKALPEAINHFLK